MYVSNLLPSGRPSEPTAVKKNPAPVQRNSCVLTAIEFLIHVVVLLSITIINTAIPQMSQYSNVPNVP